MGSDRYSRTRNKFEDRKRLIFLGMVDIILGIERHSVLGIQIGFLEEIDNVLSLFIFLLPAGLKMLNKLIINKSFLTKQNF